jgi:hypothetical protein
MFSYCSPQDLLADSYSQWNFALNEGLLVGIFILLCHYLQDFFFRTKKSTVSGYFNFQVQVPSFLASFFLGALTFSYFLEGETGKCSTTWATRPTLFVLVILDGLSLYAQVTHDHYPICASHLSWDDRCIPLHPAIVWNGVSQTFCPDWPHATILPISSS